MTPAPGPPLYVRRFVTARGYRTGSSICSYIRLTKANFINDALKHGRLSVTQPPRFMVAGSLQRAFDLIVVGIPSCESEHPDRYV